MGQSLQPLYKTVPMSAAADPVLYGYLALVDAIRVGGARESRIAIKLLSNEFKATEYLMQLDERIKALGEKPEIGKSRENIRRGYRSIRVNSHVVYYHLQVQKIDIVRVLHKRMDVEKHLPERV